MGDWLLRAQAFGPALSLARGHIDAGVIANSRDASRRHSLHPHHVVRLAEIIAVLWFPQPTPLACPFACVLAFRFRAEPLVICIPIIGDKHCRQCRHLRCVGEFMANYTPNETRLFQQAVGSCRSIRAATCRGVEWRIGRCPAYRPVGCHGAGSPGRPPPQGTRRAKCAVI